MHFSLSMRAISFFFHAMASDGLFFKSAARLNSQRTPHVAVIGQALVATILVVAFRADTGSLH